MKKLKVSILTCLLLCSLSACKSKQQIKTDAFFDAGYSDEQVEIILSLSEENQELFKEYNPSLINLVVNDKFLETNINKYLDNLDLLDDVDEDLFFYIVDEKIESKDKILNLLKDKYFMSDNLDLYLNYYDDFDKIRNLVEWVNVKGYLESFIDAEVSDVSNDILMIASKIYTIKEYIPEDLKEIPSEYIMQGNNYLRSEALNAYIEMADAARKEDQYFYVSTSYRSYSFQELLYNKYLLEDPVEVVDTYSSRPGYSDHQTGLTVDLRDYNKSFNDVKDTAPFLWLKDNSYKYGFIMRYPEGKEDITRYEYEWWHFRYVGKDVAKEIYDNQITFDEYYEYYVNN